MLKKGLSLLMLQLIAFTCFSQGKNELYSKAYGDKSNRAIIFLHGGPGYNAASFEITVAQQLADKGFYVIAYDQRGCGRSKNFPNAKFTLAENLSDIDSIYNKYHLEKAALLGHGWGGNLATFYAEENPQKVSRLIWVSTPLSYPEIFKAILNQCKKIYTQNNDTVNLKYIGMLEHMDTASLQYSNYLFLHASSCGLFFPHTESPESKQLIAKAKADPMFAVMKQSEFKPIEGIYNDIHYTTLNMSADLEKVMKDKIPVYGIYGKDDGLFDTKQIDEIEAKMKKGHFKLVSNASENIFIDQRSQFIDAVKKDMR